MKFISFAGEVHPALVGAVGFVLAVPLAIKGYVVAEEVVPAARTRQAKRDCVAIKPNLTVPVRFQIDSNCRSIPVLDQFERESRGRSI